MSAAQQVEMKTLLRSALTTGMFGSESRPVRFCTKALPGTTVKPFMMSACMRVALISSMKKGNTQSADRRIRKT